jgi:hexokinase
MKHLRQIARLITSRASALLAVAIHAFWLLRIETSLNGSATSARLATSSSASAEAVSDVLDKVSFACNGGIVQKYPDFLRQCQQHVDALRSATILNDGIERGKVVLDVAEEAAVYGAAVAAVVAECLPLSS